MPEIIDGPITVGIAPGVPDEWLAPLVAILSRTAEVQTAQGAQPLQLLDQPQLVGVETSPLPRAQANRLAGGPLSSPSWRPSPPCATMCSLDQLRQRWLGAGEACRSP